MRALSPLIGAADLQLADALLTPAIVRRLQLQPGATEQALEVVRLLASDGRLQRADEVKTHFMVSASHELRTPVTNIASATEILLQHGGREAHDLAAGEGDIDPGRERGRRAHAQVGEPVAEEQLLGVGVADPGRA